MESRVMWSRDSGRAKPNGKNTHYSVDTSYYYGFKAFCGAKSWKGLKHIRTKEDIKYLDCGRCLARLLTSGEIK